MKLGERNRKTSEKSLRRNSAYEHVRWFMRKHARGVFAVIFENRFKPRRFRPPQSRRYESPRVAKLTLEQAKLRLLGHLSIGDQGAKDLLELMFSERVANPATPKQAMPDNSGEPSACVNAGTLI